MTRNWYDLIGALAIAVLGGAVACVSTPADAEDAGPAIVAASDGSLELSIPSSALPEGVSASDLSVTMLAPIEATDPSDPNAREIAHYDLQPSGLRFEEPVAVTARLPLETVSGPLYAYLISDGGSIEILPVAITLEGETLVATTAVEHFSEIVWSVAGVAPFSLWAGGGTFVKSEPIAVGETLDLDFIASRPENGTVELKLIGRPTDGGPAVSTTASYSVEVGAGPWQLKGVFGNRSQEVLSPAFDPQPPGEWVTGSDLLLSTRGQFTCTQPGAWTVTFVGAVQFSYQARPVAGPSQGVALPTFENGARVQTLPPDTVSGRCVTVEQARGIATTNHPLVATQIEALLTPPVTSYILDVQYLYDLPLTYAWSGPDCGTNFGLDQPFLVWDHGGEDCDHTTVAHPDATIAVTVSDGVRQITCIYRGAASGSGEACGAPAQVQ